jgi:hypothetical protein
MLGAVLFGLYVIYQRQRDLETRVIETLPIRGPAEMVPGQYSLENPQYG